MLLFVLISFATARLTRLLVHDTILDGPRRRLYTYGPKWVVKLGTCPWCMSFWVNLTVWGIAWIFLSVPQPGLMMLASWGGGQLAFWVTESTARFASE